MNSLVAQHPVLWLLLALLLGVCAEWLLEVFYFRRPLADARNAARRRGEDLDSERFAHGRTQAELKSTLAEVETAQKGRTLAEAQLGATRLRIAEFENRLAAVESQRERLEGALATAERRADAMEREARSHAAEALGLKLEVAELDAAWTTESSVASQLRTRAAELQQVLDDTLSRLPELEREASSQATKSQALEADLQAAMRRHADAESALSEVRGALAAAQEELEAGRASRIRLEGEQATLTARLHKLEQAAADSKAAHAALDQKLKARIEEVKQLTTQLGEASEELSELKARSAQLDANLEAAHSTRKALEKELAERTAAAAKAAEAAALQNAAPATDPAELETLREQLRDQEKETSSWRGRAEELEAELLSTSRAHQGLEVELERLRSAGTGPTPDESLAGELEAMTRERNELAAELAVLRAARNR